LGTPPLRARPPIWLLVMITINGTMAMHMFVPALPFAARGLSTSVGEMQMTISLYILGLASGQLLYGPLSDAMGRRPVLIAGLILYAVAGLAAALAPDLHLLLGARLLQGLGGCAGLALGRAIVRDTAQADTAVRQLALMNLMMMVGPGLAPIVGGAVATSMGWRAIFWLLAAVGLLTVWLTWRLLPETGARPAGAEGGAQAARGFSFGAGVLLRSYRDLLSSVKFAGFALGGGCTTTAIYAFIAAAPFIFTTELHRSAREVGFYLGFLIVGMSAGNALTGRHSPHPDGAADARREYDLPGERRVPAGHRAGRGPVPLRHPGRHAGVHLRCRHGQPGCPHQGDQRRPGSYRFGGRSVRLCADDGRRPVHHTGRRGRRSCIVGGPGADGRGSAGPGRLLGGARARARRGVPGKLSTGRPAARQSASRPNTWRR